jgi:polyhydroxyalkanoate synthesis regulator phasin
MNNPVKKAFYLGVCAAAVTNRFVQAEVKRYLEAGHISEEEGKKIVDSAMKQLKKDRKGFENALRKEIKIGMKEAKPLIHESRQLVKELAGELVREAKATVKARGKKARKAASKAAKNARTVERKVKKIVKKKAERVKKAVKRIKKRR